MMISKGIQKSLEHSPSFEQRPITFLHSLLSKHVSQRIQLVLQPERTRRVYSPRWLQRIQQCLRLAGTHDDVFAGKTLWRTCSDDSGSFSKLPQEPLVPRFEAIIRPVGVTLEQGVILGSREGLGAKPAIRLLSGEISERDGRVQHLSVGIKDLFESDVDQLVREDHPTVLILHEVNKKSIDGEACQSSVWITTMVCKLRANGDYGVEHLEDIFTSFSLKILGLRDSMLPVKPQNRVLVDCLGKLGNSRMPQMVVSLLVQILGVVAESS